jgi:hypothetical protein
MTKPCPDCYASHPEGITCQDDFYQMLYWEADFPELGVVHHLMVLCYHLQHPHMYTAAGLVEGRRLLDDFLVRGLSTEEVRWSNRERLDSGNRSFNIKSKSGDQGKYPSPPSWKMTAADVVAGGPQHYIEKVKSWARSVAEALKDIP